MWTYVQRTGNMYHEGKLVFTGYAGGNCGKNPEGMNNPDMQDVHCIGPLPCGMYTAAPPYHNPKTGASTMNLWPDATNKMFGRADFRIHGDNPEGNHSASEGCIVKSPAIARLSVWTSNDHRLQVVAEETDRTPEQAAAIT